jgi:hypothetical protein
MAPPLDAIRRFRTPAYLIFTLGAILPLVELVLAVSPVKPSQVMWRFGAVGLFASAAAAPLIMLLLLYGVALASEDRGVLYVIGTLAALSAAILLVSSGSFTLDALQMKRQVTPAAATKFAVASVQAFVKLVLQGIAAAVLAVSAFRAGGALRREAVKKPDRSGTLVVGQPAKGKGAAADRADTPVLQSKPNG